MSIKKIKHEIESFFDELAELRERTRKLTHGSDE